MGIQINRLTNANIYANGNNLIGKAAEISLPQLKAKMSSHPALGLQFEFELPSGFEKMEAKIKWNAFYADVVEMFGDVFSSIKLQVRASLETWNSDSRESEVPVVCYLTVQTKGLPLGNYKQNDNTELESDLNVLYIKIEIDGVEMLEADALANIYKVKGEDKFQAFRNNIGA